jgi:hypothetical protein
MSVIGVYWNLGKYKPVPDYDAGSGAGKILVCLKHPK